MTISFKIVQPSIYMMAQSQDANEIISNMLAALVLDQVDNMGSLILFNWIRANYNELTVKSNFMFIKSSALF